MRRIMHEELTAGLKEAARPADTMRLSIAGVEKSIRMLKKQERLCRIGPDKGGHWKVLK